MTHDRLTTTISLRKETVQRLGELGRFNESYENVVTRLLEQSENNEVGARV